MVEQRITILNRLGMHTRAAAKFVFEAARYRCDIQVKKDGLTVDGKSIMGLMMLGAGKGDVVVIAAEGPDADSAIKKLTKLVGRKFHEKG
ncbi:MAG: HPr family phosphocarrier protein [Magnetococcales bacterium]|nr:HPr family phosphocarrier protein [Magnetococcales bacterium]